MERRDVLKLGTVAVLAAPSRAFAAVRRERADVIVIGSGGAGMSASITAFDAAARVVVLEKMPITGGNTQLAAGGMNAAETVFQKTRGIQDSVRTMFDDTYSPAPPATGWTSRPSWAPGWSTWTRSRSTRRRPPARRFSSPRRSAATARSVSTGPGSGS